MAINSRLPRITQTYDEALQKKRRAVSVKQGVLSNIEFGLLDDNGQPLNLLASGVMESSSSESASETVPYTVEVRFREAALVDREVYSATATITDHATGAVEVITPSGVRGQPGIYLMEAGVSDDEGHLVFIDTLFLFVEHSAWATSSPNTIGPPMVDDIRMSLRDSDPIENELLEEYAYDLADICWASVETIRLWNETPPPIANHSTCSFPYRNIWLLGIQMHLFKAAEEHYRRNRLPYNAGGVTVDDKNRGNEYKVAWQERQQELTRQIMRKKVQINMGRGFGTFGSNYPR